MSMKRGRYRKVQAPIGYPGKIYAHNQVYEHVLVWWRETGTVPQAGEDVHHKNENRSDNRFSNLEKKTKPEHTRIHNREKWKPAVVRCGWCKKNFTISPGKYKYRTRNGATELCCSRQCKGKKWKHGLMVKRN